MGRVDDTNEEGMIVIRELSEIVNFYDLDAEVLAASIRGPRHITDSALAGAHIATLPFKVLQQMVHHPLTDLGIVRFKKPTGRTPGPRWPRPRSDALRTSAPAASLAPADHAPLQLTTCALALTTCHRQWHIGARRRDRATRRPRAPMPVPDAGDPGRATP